MKRVRKQQLLEQNIYGVIWAVVFLLPVIGGYFAVSGGLGKEEGRMFVQDTWMNILPFFLLFLLNNYVLLPRFLFMKRYWQYAAFLLCAIGLMYCFSPSLPLKPSPREFGRGSIHRFVNGKHPKPAPFPYPPSPLRYSVPFIIAFLMTGFNIAIKLFFKSFRDEERLKDLEHQRLQSELQYLKYQINPHFFMNTLNNIHALVDIDTIKAKSTIVELSKLMRYVLYEASNKTILLSREILFLKNYIALMSLRYTDKVSIEMNFPAEVPEVQIPPLLFISFVENAFKHGVSYRSESFIRVSMYLEEDNRFSFRCTNSNHGSAGEQHHGIGLENIRKRLKLLFGNDYTLSISSKEHTFDVLLIIPLLS